MIPDFSRSAYRPSVSFRSKAEFKRRNILDKVTENEELLVKGSVGPKESITLMVDLKWQFLLRSAEVVEVQKTLSSRRPLVIILSS